MAARGRIISMKLFRGRSRTFLDCPRLIFLLSLSLYLPFLHSMTEQFSCSRELYVMHNRRSRIIRKWTFTPTFLTLPDSVRTDRWLSCKYLFYALKKKKQKKKKRNGNSCYLYYSFIPTRFTTYDGNTEVTIFTWIFLSLNAIRYVPIERIVPFAEIKQVFFGSRRERSKNQCPTTQCLETTSSILISRRRSACR